MAATTPRLPEPFRATAEIIDFNVSELMSEAAGAHSPFGDSEFPLRVDQLTYVHPTAADRPRLADGH